MITDGYDLNTIRDRIAESLRNGFDSFVTQPMNEQLQAEFIDICSQTFSQLEYYVSNSIIEYPTDGIIEPDTEDWNYDDLNLSEGFELEDLMEQRVANTITIPCVINPDPLSPPPLSLEAEEGCDNCQKVYTILRQIREWDMLNPGDGQDELLADAPWLRDLLERALLLIGEK